MPGPDLTITPPFGYGEVVPLQRTDRVLLPRGSTPEFCRSINALALSYSEFVAAGRDYPVVFASGDAGGTYAPVVVLGLAEEQNLFVSAAGEWEPASYLPAFVRRYPFCISKIYVDGKPRSERMVCVARAYLDPQGVELFDAAGKASQRWQAIEQLLQEYENDLDLTARMCATFSRLGLFSPFRFQVLHDQAARFTMEGMYRVDEKRLEGLTAEDLKELVSGGLMGRIYAHFHSLENFGRLYQRALARAAEEHGRKSRGIER